MHIGILGGTFNPIHYGHLRIAEEVREACLTDKVIFIPSYLPPHKERVDLISSEDRLEIVRLSIQNNHLFGITDIEIKRKGRSYSIETLKELRGIYGEETALSFILGIDAFLEISTWKDYNKLFKFSNFIVTGRYGYSKEKLDEVLPVETSKSICSGHSISFLDTTILDISSTMIRQRVKEGRSIKYLVPSKVEDYIVTHRLYR